MIFGARKGACDPLKVCENPIAPLRAQDVELIGEEAFVVHGLLRCGPDSGRIDAATRASGAGGVCGMLLCAGRTQRHRFSDAIESARNQCSRSANAASVARSAKLVASDTDVDAYARYERYPVSTLAQMIESGKNAVTGRVRK
jgi:hypothetical protein